jgi:hypothetical protein
MPIRAYQDGQKFDGETIRQMGIAFEMALASLRATPDCNDPIRAALAQRIIALAKAGERDAERLCEGALQAVSPADLSDRPEGGPSRGRNNPRMRAWPRSCKICAILDPFVPTNAARSPAAR